jgi:LacI family transcriptional regulator
MNRRNKRTITIQDIAEAAGVSVSTVSRVLNDKDDVAPDTYDRVKLVIEELGYTSSLAARSMRSRKTGVIGLIMPDVEGAFPLEVMKGVNRGIAELDYDLIVYTSGDIRKNTTIERERQYVSLFNSITDGLIIVTPAATNFPTETPVVAVDPHNKNTDYPAVIATNRKGAMTAMDYLIDLGHRRIGFIGGCPELESAIRRLQGYKESLSKAGIAVDPELIVPGDFTTETGLVCAQKLLSLENPPTAIFAANDQSAFGVYLTAQEKGLRIPEDLSLIGFDNIPEAEFINLTTMNQSIVQMGYAATRMLERLIQGETLEEKVVKLPTNLIVRGSCRSLK